MILFQNWVGKMLAEDVWDMENRSNWSMSGGNVTLECVWKKTLVQVDSDLFPITTCSFISSVPSSSDLTKSIHQREGVTPF